MKSRRGGPKSKQIWYLLAAKLIPFLMGIEHTMYIFRSQGAREVLLQATLNEEYFLTYFKFYPLKLLNRQYVMRKYIYVLEYFIFSFSLKASLTYEFLLNEQRAKARIDNVFALKINHI